MNWISDFSLDLDNCRCPSDRGYTGYHYPAWRDSALSSYDHHGASYAANTLWAGSPVPERCLVSSFSPYLRALSRVTNPANTLYYMENCGRFARFAWNINNDDDGAGCDAWRGMWASRSDGAIIRGWHGRAFLFAASFVDAHAGSVRMEGRRDPPPRLSRYPTVVGPDDDDNDLRYRCVIIRGPGWQVDALPAPGIPTRFQCSQLPSFAPPIEQPPPR